MRLNDVDSSVSSSLVVDCLESNHCLSLSSRHYFKTPWNFHVTFGFQQLLDNVGMMDTYMDAL